jgi:hypothetical protein
MDKPEMSQRNADHKRLLLNERQLGGCAFLTQGQWEIAVAVAWLA